ncbi:DNA cytosine methyltransferase [Pedobacter sp. Leaf250]|uniref:DNA cytosine methyltransferase n=1 Tax=Pedobacter sp. Leaf250 TaxID=2876559 RepID=UPI001E37A9D6|nr:DNA (cytosine-5-)-methyltransferase [Pedobacter sp. Leaf250]
MKINVIDLFAGCGGLTDGFIQSGRYNTIAGVEWEFPMVKTLRERLKSRWGYENAEQKVVHFDIQRTEELLNGFDDPKFGSSDGLVSLCGEDRVDMIVGGPPCQAYSMAGRVKDSNGMKNDYRNFLFESYVKIVEHFRPHAFVFENVEGILSAKPGDIAITDRIRTAFNDAGYDITADLRKDALFDTSLFGVPQKRRRVIIYGVKKSETSSDEVSAFYKIMRSKETAQPALAGSAFKNLPAIFPLENLPGKASHKVENGKEDFVSNHSPRVHNSRDIAIFRLLAKDIENGAFEFTSSQALIRLYQESTGKASKFHKYHVIRRDRPSNTIPAHLYKDGLRHIHPDPAQARSITVREAARIQTFDDDFEFLGSQGDNYKMIGNAVPPLFARVISEITASLFDKYAEAAVLPAEVL